MFGRVSGDRGGPTPSLRISVGIPRTELRQQSADTGERNGAEVTERNGESRGRRSAGVPICGVIHPWRVPDRANLRFALCFPAVAFRSERCSGASSSWGYGGRGRSPFRTLVAWRTSELRQQSADRRTQRRSRSGGRRAAVCWRLLVALTGRAASGWVLRGNLVRSAQQPKSSVLVVPTSDVVNRRHG